MKEKPEVSSLREALLYYTQAKIEMAKKFRRGVNREDFAEFDRELTRIDKMLKRCARKIKQEIEPT